MVLPLYATLEKLDESLLEAAADLGCPRWKTFWLVTLPLSSPGVLAGVLLCFIPIVGEFVIPDLLGGSQTPMIGQTIWMEFFGNKDWPAASAVAVVLVVPAGHADRRLPAPGACAPRSGADHAQGLRIQSRRDRARHRLSLSADRHPGDLFVQRLALVAVWGGWSTHWYAELIDDAPLLDAAFISMRVALVSATAATILGTLAAVALVRFGRFRGRLLFASMIYAPLVMPEVITGLSHAAAVRRHRGRSRLLDRGHRAHHHGDVLRHRDRAVAARRFRHEPRRSGDGSRRPAAAHVPAP